MSRKKDVGMSSFKIKLLKAQATTNALPFCPLQNNFEVRLDEPDPVETTLTRVGLGEGP